MKHTRLIILILPFLVACLPSQGVYDPLLYHTQDFASNMYEDEFFNHIQSRITDQSTLTLTSYSTLQPSQNDPNGDSFAMEHRLSNRFTSLKYGYESKLFDGILYCTDAQRLSKSRLQLLPTGTGFYLPRSLTSMPSLALFMKAGADTNAGAQKIIDLVVNLSFYLPSTNGFLLNQIHVEINDLVPSNYPGYYGFSIPENLTAGALAFGFSYTILDPIPSITLANKTGVFLYEVLFPNATWA